MTSSLRDVLLGFASEVLNIQEQRHVESDLDCGEVPLATDKVLVGIHFSVMEKKIGLERARVMYTELGRDPRRVDDDLACFC